MKRNRENASNKKASRLYLEERRFYRTINILLTVIIFVVFSAMGVMAIFVYDNRVEADTEAEAQTVMQDISEQVSLRVATTIDDWLRQLVMLDNVLDTLNSASDSYMDELNEAITDTASNSTFETLGLILQSGDLYYIDEGVGKYYNIAAEEIAHMVTLKRQRFVGRIYITGMGEKIIFGIPYGDELGEAGLDDAATERISGVAGIVSPEQLSQILHSTAFLGTAYIALFQKDGSRIVDSYYGTPQSVEINNVFNIISQTATEEAYTAFVEDIANGNSDIIKIVAQNQTQLCHYSNFGASLSTETSDSWQKDWNVMIVVAQSIIMRNITPVLELTRTVIFALIIIICVALALLLLSSEMSRSRRGKLLYVDPVTDGINESRFKMDAAVLVNRYANDNFAIVYVSFLRMGFVVAERLKLLKAMHEAFLDELQPHELVCRMYNDRFALLLEAQDKPTLLKHLNKIADKVKASCYEVELVSLPLSMGVYLLPKQGEVSAQNIETALDNASVAQGSTTKLSDSLATFFTEDMLLGMQKSLELEMKQESALAAGHFHVYYQLKRDIQNNTWCGAEALARWIDPEKGFISPGVFVPIFEDNGFILQLDVYMFECVCRDIKTMLELGVPAKPISVNLSRRHLYVEGFLDEYERIIKKYDIPPQYIELELTESMMFEEVQKFVNVVSAIHEMGCRCSIDDFGSGYSSLSMLKEYDFDVVKLDRSFFNSNGDLDDKTKQIVSTLIKLSHDLGKTIVAEGIETEQQVQFLREVGCDCVQGYYFARPLPFEESLKKISK